MTARKDAAGSAGKEGTPPGRAAAPLQVSGDLLTLAATSLTLLMEARCCLIRTHDFETGRYVPQVTYGFKGSELRRLTELDRRVVVEVLLSGKPRLFEDLSRSERFRDWSGDCSTLLCQPLRHGREIIGTMTLFDRSREGVGASPFRPDDLERIGRLVSHLERVLLHSEYLERQEASKGHDEVTGLPNQRYFRTRLLAEVAKAKRFHSRLELISCECDIRIRYSDFYGRRHHDRILHRIALAIRKSLREYDVVARVGEGKFAILLPEALGGGESVTARVEEAVDTVSKSLQDEGMEVEVQLFFSQAIFPDHGEECEDLLLRIQLV